MKIKKYSLFFSKLLAVFAFVFSIYNLMVVALLFNTPFSRNEADLNHSGLVSITEAAYVSSYDTHNVIINGKQCIEYFTLKDGLTIKHACNDN